MPPFSSLRLAAAVLVPSASLPPCSSPPPRCRRARPLRLDAAVLVPSPCLPPCSPPPPRCRRARPLRLDAAVLVPSASMPPCSSLRRRRASPLVREDLDVLRQLVGRQLLEREPGALAPMLVDHQD